MKTTGQHIAEALRSAKKAEYAERRRNAYRNRPPEQVEAERKTAQARYLKNRTALLARAKNRRRRLRAQYPVRIKYQKWTEAELLVLRDPYLTVEKRVRLLGRPWTSVVNKIARTKHT